MIFLTLDEINLAEISYFNTILNLKLELLLMNMLQGAHDQKLNLTDEKNWI